MIEAAVTVSAEFTKRYLWAVDLSVFPAEWHLFPSDTGTSEYRIRVAKDEGTAGAALCGQVGIANAGREAVRLRRIVLDIAPPPGSPAVRPVKADLRKPVLPPGESFRYQFRAALPAEAVIPGGTYRVTARVSTADQPAVVTQAAVVTLPEVPVPVSDSIHVDDTNGLSICFPGSGSLTYTRRFTGADEGCHRNVVILRETGASAEASVTVHRQSLEACYQVTVDLPGLAGVRPRARSLLTLSNPAANLHPAVISGVAGGLPGACPTGWHCDRSFPTILMPGESLTGFQSAELPDRSPRLSAVTARVQGFCFRPDGAETPAGGEALRVEALLDPMERCCQSIWVHRAVPGG